MKSKLLTVVLLISSFVVSPIAASAGWIDTWYDQYTTSGPQSFQGQKRGYWSAGSFQGRSPVQSDYPITVMPPRLKAGCGGIDLLFGGFSFLNFEYMVQKFQRIIQAAPAAAFDLALNVLCEPCSKTVKSLDGIVNALNQLQLDECQGSRVIAAKILEPTTNWMTDPAQRETAQGELARIHNDFLQKSGIASLWDAINKQTDNSGGRPQVDMRQLISGCPAEFTSVFGKAGSVIDTLREKMGISDSSFAALVRGFVGDVEIDIVGDAGSQMYLPVYVPPCPQNDNRSVDNLLSGEVYGREAGSTCAPISDVNKSLLESVRASMRSVASKIKNRQPLTEQESAFISASPLSVGLVLKSAVGSQADDEVIQTFADLHAKAFAFAFMTDLYRRTAYIASQGEQIAAKQGQGDPNTCQPSIVSGAVAELRKLAERAERLAGAVLQSYTASVQQASSLLAVVDSVKKQSNEVIHKELSQRFGKSVASRALGID